MGTLTRAGAGAGASAGRVAVGRRTRLGGRDRSNTREGRLPAQRALEFRDRLANRRRLDAFLRRGRRDAAVVLSSENWRCEGIEQVASKQPVAGGWNWPAAGSHEWRLAARRLGGAGGAVGAEGRNPGILGGQSRQLVMETGASCGAVVAKLLI